MKKLIFLLLFVSAAASTQPVVFSATITRPTNATPYTAGDAVSAASDSLLELLIPAD